jgi:hypothetical protein
MWKQLDTIQRSICWLLHELSLKGAFSTCWYSGTSVYVLKQPALKEINLTSPLSSAPVSTDSVQKLFNRASYACQKLLPLFITTVVSSTL